MSTLFFNTATRQISYETPYGLITIPAHTSPPHPSQEIISYPFVCILGVIRVDPETEYLFFCSKSETLGTYNDGEVFSITSVNCLPLSETRCNEMVEGIKNLLEGLNFYYTFQAVEDEFQWNKDMVGNFLEYLESRSHSPETEQDEGPYRLKSRRGQPARNPFTRKFAQQATKRPEIDEMVVGRMICGYFESRMTRNNGDPYILKILSRISVRKIGPRMISRGIDANGDVSFFVETRFITKSNERSDEFVILRGSVPLYWCQDDPLKPGKLALSGDKEENEAAFVKHMERLNKKYGKIVVVDLLGHRKYEKLLARHYREMCQKHGVDYIHFDINRLANSVDGIKAVFYDQLDEFMSELGRRGADGEKGTIIRDFKIQAPSFIGLTDHQGDENDWDEPEERAEPPRSNSLKSLGFTFRVNCMDCLDRTNLAQSLIFGLFDEFKFSIARSMWMNNGNALSNMYTGSDALKGELHGSGKRSVIGRMNDLVISANRMINNKFTDKDKQNIIDTILGRKSS